ncbi:MAG: hypothetical protein EP329_13320 [Deltaproteobacteria bacterium]|nr:MAG: hypothetical protein EP329_13320 [Deltaproteobacteria bacterium]
MVRAVLSLLLVALLSGSAAAASFQYFLPQAIELGGGESIETYVLVNVDVTVRLTGPALVDAAMKELKAKLPEVEAIAVVPAGRAASVKLDAARADDPNVADRALGAVYYTLLQSGVREVTRDGKPVTAGTFTRGALVPVLPIGAALPPGRVATGFVEAGDEIIPAVRFYERLAASDKSIQQAARTLLETAGTTTRLHLLKNIAALRLKEQDAVVIDRLGDASAEVRLAALELLKGKSTTPVVKALEGVVEKDQASDVKLAAVRMLVGLGKNEYEKYLLLDKLSSPDAAVVVAAIKGLVKTGDTGFASGIAGLVKHNNAVVREAAVSAVTELKQFGLMTEWLDDQKIATDIREKAGRTLADVATGPERARGVSWLVTDAGAANAVYAAKLVEKERIPGTTLALGKALTRSEPDVRKAAALALGALKDTAGLEPLAAAVRAAADAGERELFTQQATTIIGVQPLDQVIRISKSTDPTVSELAIKSLAAFSQDKPNKRANAVLIEALGSGEAPVRQAAAYALARIPDDEIAAKLAGLKDDADPLVRAQVAYAMGHSSRPEGEAILVAYLDDRESDVKVAAIDGVRERKIASALDKVKWLVANRKIEIKRAAMETLVALATPGDPKLFDIYDKAMLESDEQVRHHGVAGLGGYRDDPRATRAIGGVVSDERASKDLKLFALSTLSQMTEPDTFEQVVRGLFDRDVDVKLAALDALEKLGSNKATRPLQEFILGETDKTVQERAQAVLEKL